MKIRYVQINSCILHVITFECSWLEGPDIEVLNVGLKVGFHCALLLNTSFTYAYSWLIEVSGFL